MAAQARDKGLRFPRTERRMGAIALAPWLPSPSFRELSIDRGLVDKDQPRQCLVEERLAMVDPQITGTRDLGP